MYCKETPFCIASFRLFCKQSLYTKTFWTHSANKAWPKRACILTIWNTQYLLLLEPNSIVKESCLQYVPSSYKCQHLLWREWWYFFSYLTSGCMGRMGASWIYLYIFFRVMEPCVPVLKPVDVCVPAVRLSILRVVRFPWMPGIEGQGVWNLHSSRITWCCHAGPGLRNLSVVGRWPFQYWCSA